MLLALDPRLSAAESPAPHGPQTPPSPNPAVGKGPRCRAGQPACLLSLSSLNLGTLGEQAAHLVTTGFGAGAGHPLTTRATRGGGVGVEAAVKVEAGRTVQSLGTPRTPRRIVTSARRGASPPLGGTGLPQGHA